MFKTLAIGAVILGFVYGVLQLVIFIGFFKVISALYLLLGFMVAWETRQGQGHRLWFLVIPLWLPMIILGLSRRGSSLLEEVNEKIAEEEVKKSSE